MEIIEKDVYCYIHVLGIAAILASIFYYLIYFAGNQGTSPDWYAAALALELSCPSPTYTCKVRDRRKLFFVGSSPLLREFRFRLHVLGKGQQSAKSSFVNSRLFFAVHPSAQTRPFERDDTNLSLTKPSSLHALARWRTKRERAELSAGDESVLSPISRTQT